MPKMYQLGCEPIVVHPSQVENAERNGWSLKPPTLSKKRQGKEALGKSETPRQGS
jgi:hypothetical protein